jgi:hypothetical protein
MTKHQRYLKNMLVEIKKLGYQVRICQLQPCGYGGPQAWPRLCILAALKCPYLPKIPVKTHGEGTSMGHLTVRDANQSMKHRKVMVEFVSTPSLTDRYLERQEVIQANHWLLR